MSLHVKKTLAYKYCGEAQIKIIVEKIDFLLNNKEYFSKIRSNVEKFNIEINSLDKYKQTIDKIYKEEE